MAQSWSEPIYIHQLRKLYLTSWTGPIKLNPFYFIKNYIIIITHGWEKSGKDTEKRVGRIDRVGLVVFLLLLLLQTGVRTNIILFGHSKR